MYRILYKCPCAGLFFCTIRFLHYIVQNLIPITTVQQVAAMLFNITLQNYLFQFTYKNNPQSTLPIVKIQQRISHRHSLLITTYQLQITHYFQEVF